MPCGVRTPDFTVLTRVSITRWPSCAEPVASACGNSCLTTEASSLTTLVRELMWPLLKAVGSHLRLFHSDPALWRFWTRRWLLHDAGKVRADSGASRFSQLPYVVACRAGRLSGFNPPLRTFAVDQSCRKTPTTAPTMSKSPLHVMNIVSRYASPVLMSTFESVILRGWQCLPSLVKLRATTTKILNGILSKP